MHVIINYFIPDGIQLGHNSGFDKTVQNSACNIHDNGRVSSNRTGQKNRKIGHCNPKK